jgi:hypothetical protein
VFRFLASIAKLSREAGFSATSRHTPTTRRRNLHIRPSTRGKIHLCASGHQVDKMHQRTAHCLKKKKGVATCRLRLKCDGTCAEIRFRLSAKRTSPFKSAGASVQSTTGSRGVRNSGSNAGYTTFRGSVKSTGYPLQWPVSPSLPLPCVTGCHHISTGLYTRNGRPNAGARPAHE